MLSCENNASWCVCLESCKPIGRDRIFHLCSVAKGIDNLFCPFVVAFVKHLKDLNMQSLALSLNQEGFDVLTSESYLRRTKNLTTKEHFWRPVNVSRYYFWSFNLNCPCCVPNISQSSSSKISIYIICIK